MLLAVISLWWPLGATHLSHLVLVFIYLLSLLGNDFSDLETPHFFVFMRGSNRLGRSDVNVLVSLIIQLNPPSFIS